MRPHSSECLGCGARCFPARLRCHGCGGMQFTPVPVSSARVAAVTRVHRAPPGCAHDHLVELHAEGGVRLLAVARFAPVQGSQVRPIATEDGAIVVPLTESDSEERSQHG